MHTNTQTNKARKLRIQPYSELFVHFIGGFVTIWVGIVYNLLENYDKEPYSLQYEYAIINHKPMYGHLFIVASNYLFPA